MTLYSFFGAMTSSLCLFKALVAGREVCCYSCSPFLIEINYVIYFGFHSQNGRLLHLRRQIIQGVYGLGVETLSAQAYLFCAIPLLGCTHLNLSLYRDVVLFIFFIFALFHIDTFLFTV